MNDIFFLVLGLTGQWLLGIALAVGILGIGGVTRQLSIKIGTLVDRAELLGLGIVLGVAATSLLQFLWSLCGGSLGRPLSVGLSVIGIVAGVAAWIFCRRASSTEPPEHVPDGNSDARTTTTLIKASAAIIVLLFVAVLVQTLLTPQRWWDERAIFGIKSALLFEDGTIYSPDLAAPDFVQGHPRYPLLIPLAEHHIYALLGRIDDRWSKIIFPVLYLGMVLTFAGVLVRHVHPAQAWLFALMLATIPVLAANEYGFLSAQADAPMGCYHGITVLYLWDWIRIAQLPGSKGFVPTRGLLLAAVVAGMTIFTKDEGIAFFMVDLVTLCLVSLMGARRGASHKFSATNPASTDNTQPHSYRRAASAILMFAAVTVALLAPWMWHRSGLPANVEMNYSERLSLENLKTGSKTIRWSVSHVVGRMFLAGEVWTWGLQWWVMAAALLSRPRRAVGRSQLLLVGDLCGALAALLVAGMLSPTAVEEHIGGSSHRFLMQIAPVAVLFIAGQWGSRPTASAQ